MGERNLSYSGSNRVVSPIQRSILPARIRPTQYVEKLSLEFLRGCDSDTDGQLSHFLSLRIW